MGVNCSAMLQPRRTKHRAIGADGLRHREMGNNYYLHTQKSEDTATDKRACSEALRQRPLHLALQPKAITPAERTLCGPYAQITITSISAQSYTASAPLIAASVGLRLYAEWSCKDTEPMSYRTVVSL